MDTSIFLAKALGLYLVIVSIPFFFGYKNLKPIVNEFFENRAMLFLSAILALILGIILVLIHNIWVMDWRIVITLLAWLTLLKGLVRLYLPLPSQKMARRFESKKSYLVIGAVTFIIGLFLLYHGFIYH